MEESQSPTTSNMCKAQSSGQCGSVHNLLDNSEQLLCVVKDSVEHAEENVAQFHNDRSETLYAKNRHLMGESNETHVNENTEQEGYQNMGQQNNINNQQNSVNISVDNKIGDLLAETSDHLQEKSVKSVMEISGQKGDDNSQQSYMQTNEYHYVRQSKMAEEKKDGCLHKNGVQQPFGNDIVTLSVEAIEASNTGTLLSVFVDVKEKQREQDCNTIVSSSVLGESSLLVMESREDSMLCTMGTEDSYNCVCNSPDINSNSVVDKTFRSVCRTLTGIERACASKGCKDLGDETPQQDSLPSCSSTPDLLEGGICLENQRSPSKCCRLQPGCTGDHVCTSRHSEQQLRCTRPISEREGIFVSQLTPTDQAIHPSQGSQMEDMDVGLNERLYYSSDLPDLNGTNLEEYLPLTDVTNTSSTLDDTNEVPIDSMVDEHKDMNHGDNIRDECVDSQVDNDGGNIALRHDHGNQEESRNYPGYFEVVQHDECSQLQETSAHGGEAYQSSTENQIKEDSEVESLSCMSEDEGVTADNEDTLSSEEMLSIQKSEDTGGTSCFTPDVDDHRGPSPEMACLSHESSDYMCRKQNNASIIPHLVVHPGEQQQNYMENVHTPPHFDQNEESTSSNSNTYPFLNTYANNLRYGDVNLAEINIARKGLKRKFDDPYNQHVSESRHSYYKDGVYSSLSQHAEYNYLCQYYQGYGRPPDVSTWTAVTSPFSQYPYTASPCSAWKGLNYNMIASDQADSGDSGVFHKNPPAYPSDPFFSSHYYPPTSCTSSKAVSEGYPPSYFNHMTANMPVPSSFSAVNHNEMFSTPTNVTQEPSMYDKQSLVNYNQRYQYANTNMPGLQQAWSDANLVNTGPNIQVFTENTNSTNPQYASFNYCGEDQKHMDTKRSISSSLRDTLVPFKARNTKIVCTVNDLYTKTVKSILKKAEENYQQEKDGVVLPQDLSIHKPTEASLKLTEQYRSECRSKSPISALSSALDLSQKSANKRKQLQYAEGEMIGQPAVAVPIVFSSSMITSHSESSCSSDATSISATSVVSSSASRQEVSGTEVSSGYCMPLFQKGAYPAGTLLQAVPNCFGPIRSSLVSPYYSVLPVYPKSSPYQHPSAMMTAIPLYANKVPSAQNQVQIQPSAASAASPSEEVTGCASQQYGTQVTGYHSYPPNHATHGDQGYDPTNVGVSSSVLSYLPGPACKQDVKVVPSTGQPKKTFKPRHFDFTKLCIGTFMYTCALNDYSRTARIKFLFSKRRLVYEFQLNDINDVSTTERKQLTEIDIPFSSIVGLWTCERELRLEVSCPPKMFLGHKGHEKQRKFGVQTCAVYDRKKTVDLTNGQLTSIPYHYIHLKMCVGDKIKSELCSFDTRFEELLKKPFIVNTNKSLVSPDFDPALSHPLLYPIPPRSGLTQVPAVQSSTSPGRVRQPSLQPKKKGSLFAGCRCIHSCRNLQCSCCAHTESCTSACACRNCRNPLNLLLRMGIPSAIAQTDLCLMDNIYMLENLDDYLNATVRLECCGIQMLLLRCVPGSFKCPNTHCNVHYRFSWCHAMLCNEGVAPRNHCTKCGRCTDFRNVHCQKCNKCYFAGISGFKCPTCKVEEMERNQQSPAEEP
ncbi:hypothetical protein ACJMK2_037835 [Sinanodonta woodiana]|uniref:Tesmin/TSO1-like CXC domain-containing protein n=1 Tax=Sinanodonta woodiana TaxID=1069815 RepID=A0ABD3WLQ5_SINWO